MLKLPTLNNLEAQEIFDKALQQLDLYDGSWKTRGPHDPGITLLETLSVLKRWQMEEIDQVTSKSLFKFLKLLGLSQEHACAAETYVSIQVERDTYIPKGAEFKCHNLCFEAGEGSLLLNNSIKAWGVKVSGKLSFHSYSSNVNRQTLIFESGNFKDKEFYIAFDKPLLTGKAIHLYFQLYEELNLKRNPITNEETFVSLSELAWEYYGEYEGSLGWHNIEIIKDSTYGLLFSGCFNFKLQGKHKKISLPAYEPCYAIRVRLIRDGFDRLPVLQSLWFNALCLRQQETKCKSFMFTYSEFLAENMVFDSYLALDVASDSGLFKVFAYNNEGFTAAEDIGITFFIVVNGDTGTFKLQAEDFEKAKSILANRNISSFKLVLYNKSFYSHRILGSGDGIANKIFEIKGLLKEHIILSDAMEVFVKGADKWHTWSITESFDTALPKDKVYYLNPENFLVQFGNNINGKVPARGIENICITSLTVTKGESGNIQKLLINEADYDKAFGKMEIFHFIEAHGGCNEEKVEKILERASKAVETSSKKAVTELDYKRFALSTQGLLINQATVIPLYKPFMMNYPESKEEHTLTVVVDFPSEKREEANMSAYIINLEKQLRQYKLITTRLHVMLPEYIPIDVHVELVLKTEGVDIVGKIKSIINEYLQNMQAHKLGGILYHGDLFGIIENVEYVSRVNYLRLELPMHKGEVNSFGDLHIPPYAKVFLRDIHAQI